MNIKISKNVYTTYLESIFRNFLAPTQIMSSGNDKETLIGIFFMISMILAREDTVDLRILIARPKRLDRSSKEFQGRCNFWNFKDLRSSGIQITNRLLASALPNLKSKTKGFQVRKKL